MNINWKVRFKNPYFWAALIAAIAAPMLAGSGLEWEEVTSWSILLDSFIAGIMNPVVLLAMAVAALGVINDPTTKGIADSSQAMEYTAPKVDGKHAKLEYIDNEYEV